MMLRPILNAVVFFFWTAFFSAGGLIIAILSPNYGIPRWARLWGRGALWMSGVKVSIEGTENITGERSFIVMPNHTSHFDIVSLYGLLPLDVRMVAKRELVKVPIFGWALRLGAAIIIDRGNRLRAIASIARAQKALDNGSSVVMFPEGTRTPPGVIGPFKKGPFYLAEETGVPVLPVGIEGAHEVMPKGEWRIFPGRIEIRVGRPVRVEALATSEERRVRLADAVRTSFHGLVRVSGPLHTPTLTPQGGPPRGSAPSGESYVKSAHEIPSGHATAGQRSWLHPPLHK